MYIVTNTHDNLFKCITSFFFLLQPQSQATMIPLSITFNWRRGRVRPAERVQGQPVILNGKLYVRHWSYNDAVLEYTPENDRWAQLPHPPVKLFTVATLKGQLLVVGGEDKSGKTSSAIFTFDNRSRKWTQSYPAMPNVLSFSAAIGYQDHLIVAGGCTHHRIPDVHYLNTNTNNWKAAQPLPSTDYYYTVLIGDTLCLVGQHTATVLRAHIPALISGAKSGVWEKVTTVPYKNSSPVTISNTLITVGGEDDGSNPTASIQMYEPITKEWTRVGTLPKAASNACCDVINSELFVLGSFFDPSVFVSKLVYDHT